MELVQMQHELAVGEKLIAWLNARDGTSLAFLHRGDPAPDLVFGAGRATLGVEVGAAYYDGAHGKVLWDGARDKPGASRTFSGVGLDKALLESIARLIAVKCRGAYGSHVVLLVPVRPAFTTASEMDALLLRLKLPTAVSFSAIYVAGDFPTSPSERGGYRVWQVHPAPKGPEPT